MRTKHEINMPNEDPYRPLEKLTGSILSKKKLPKENKKRAIAENKKIQA